MMDANASHPTCVSDRLPDYLGGKLSESEMRSIEEHLSGCSHCAGELERQAASEDAWTEARSLLVADELDGGCSLSAVSIDRAEPISGQARATFDASMLTREIKGWLDPTDDPNSLGRFAGYEIVGVIGHGGMGIVLKGFESALNRFVAIKAMAPRLASSEAARKRFAREAQAAAAVIHENVIAIHRVDDAHGLPFLVMPYWGGESLQRRIDELGTLGLEVSLRIASQIAAGLAAAHERGLIHRDIKPANILMGRGISRVTITDFGLARAADDASVTRTGVIAGTPQYMSPEQANGKPLDARSDLFSLGSVLYAMLTGEPPFEGTTNHEIVESVARGKALPLNRNHSDLPQWTARLIEMLHQTSTDQRIESASQVQHLIDACLRHLQNPNSPLPTVLASDCQSRPWWSGRAMALLAFLILALGWLFDQANRPTTLSSPQQAAEEVTRQVVEEGPQRVAGAEIWSSDQLDDEISQIESVIEALEE